MARMGPLLEQVLNRFEASMGVEAAFLAAAAHVGVGGEEGRLPVVMKSNCLEPREGESWEEFKGRSEAELSNIRDVVGEEAEFIYAASSVSTALAPDRARAQVDNPLIETVELDPLVDVRLMDDAILDVGAAPFRASHGDLKGRGVRVAVIDSGIDDQHPFLDVSASVSTCGESVDRPGSHGTHCAGSIASRDVGFPGVAPDVTLLNVKAMRANGSATQTMIGRGVDAAIELQADILSMSLGFNHLPAWSNEGHGWACPDGRCPLCTAVNRAVGFGKTVIVAAGNEHEKAEFLRSIGRGASFDTEYGCPGQAQGAIAVAAVTKRTFLPASFSSRGASSYGEPKPQLCAPGVNIMSTIPVPRSGLGVPVAGTPRALLFGRKSGTSMATPIVAGVAALIMEDRRNRGLPTEPTDMRTELLRATSPLAHPANVVGSGLGDLARY